MKKAASAHILLGLGFLAYLAPVLILCALPPTARDALIHHLAVPKIWLVHGKMIELPWAPYSYTPMNLDMLYMACLRLGSDIAPACIHWLFGLGAGALVFLHLDKRVSRAWALFGGLFFLTTPIVFRLSTMAYVDLGLTFFVCASILALIKWMEGGYASIRVLLLSGLCVGLSVGAKPNGLPALCFGALILVFYAARDNRSRQGRAAAWGAVFVLTALAAASPWLIRSWLLTGNPVYPLFSPDAGGGLSLSFFEKRRVLFGESLWQHLLIPVRMFFCGRDNNPALFDGVLNPLLLLAAPLAWGWRERRREAGVFTAFSLLFIAVVFFKGGPRVRYLACILPFLAIMAVQGLAWLEGVLKNRMEKSWKPLAWAPAALALAGLAYNANYIQDYFRRADPMPYITGKESRQEFLSKRLMEYPAAVFINENLPENARVMLLLMGRRGYYLDRDYFHKPLGGAEFISDMARRVNQGGSAGDILRAEGATHVLLNVDFLFNHLSLTFERAEAEAFLADFKNSTHLLFQANGCMVLETAGATPGPSGEKG